MESYDAAKLLHNLRNLHIELCSPLSLEKELLLLGIKFRRYAKEEANQQRVTWMDFLTRKKNYAKTFY